MPRAGELQYYERIGEQGRQHSLGKPFSDDECGLYLMRAGALFSLLPKPPARVLDCGCGTGWLAYFLTQRGYDVVATDIAPDAISLAQSHPLFRQGSAPRFLVADSESLMFSSEFDAVVFFDSLHHALDERKALTGAFRALRPGGVCVVLEPGRGHARKSRAFDAAYDVTDRDMPPSRVCRAARAVGFTRCRVAAAPQHLGKALYTGRFGPLRHVLVQAILFWKRWYCGIAILEKD